MAAHRKRQLPEDTAQICQAAFGYRPRAEQIQVVEMLGRMKDCILIAGTGWGKTLVYFLPLLIWPNDIILIVSPLKVLSDEQHSKLVALGIPSINIKQETRTNIADLASGKYRAVFTSPEIIFKSSRLSALWQDKGWRSRLRNIVVDEAHCVGTWGMDFRQAYSQLGRLRAMAHPDVSFLAVSATLPPALLTTLTSSMLFKNATVVNVGNDRINIKYTVSIMKHGRSTFHDLFFLKDKVKTIVYFQTLMEVESAAVYVKALVGVNSVAIFHAAKSELYKRNKMEDFKQNRVCILLSTEAAGMGCDISDVIRVVQYGYPGSISVLFQRLGRAGRNPALQGISIFLVPSQAPSLVDPFLRDYVTISSCRRRYVNEVFQNTHRDVDAHCCDNCHPDLPPEEDTEAPKDAINAAQDCGTEASSSASTKATTQPRTAGQKQLAKQIIMSWRDQTFDEHYRGKFMLFTPECLMTDATIQKLAEKCGRITTPESILTTISWLPLKSEFLQDLGNRLVKFNNDIEVQEAKKNTPLPRPYPSLPRPYPSLPRPYPSLPRSYPSQPTTPACPATPQRGTVVFIPHPLTPTRQSRTRYIDCNKIVPPPRLSFTEIGVESDQESSGQAAPSLLQPRPRQLPSARPELYFKVQTPQGFFNKQKK